MIDSRTRRTFLAGGAAFAAAAATLPLLDRSVGLGARPAYAAAADNASRAAETYAAMQQAFYDATQKRYREHLHPVSGDQPYSYLWSFEEAARATLMLVGVPSAPPPPSGSYSNDAKDRLAAREWYWDGNARARAYRSYPPSGDRYYDDDDWVGSDLLQHYLLLPTDTVALDRAASVFDFVQSGWQNNLANRGGVRWVDASWNGDRGAAATAGFGKLAAHLYDATGRKTRSYLDWAQRSSDWLTRYLLSSQSGLYVNAMRADGVLDQNLWIYNQGVVVGANVLLYRVTGTAGYLTEARRLADATLRFFSNNFADPYYSAAGAGVGPYPGRGIFNAIFFRNLLLLHAVQPAYVPAGGVSYLTRIQTYADTAWDDVAAQGKPGVRDAATGLFNLNGGEYSLLDQAGMAQVYAALAWPASSYGKLT